MTHRPEIDGLRTVAVVPVILLHAGFAIFPGGFVGVDVFFVISGFLITGIIVNDLERDRFSLLGFYDRRARRILPALFTVMLVCLPFAWFLMLPDFLENFGQSLFATTLFANNVLLTLTSGYWELESAFKPMLHTWSLAVEEQYYVVFPLLMIALWPRFRHRVLWPIALIGVVSFVLCLVLLEPQPEATFYLLHTRAWELLIGAGAALWQHGRKVPANDPAALCGIAMIAVSLFAFEPHTPFPSAYALIPTVGTALVLLFARDGTWVARILSMPALVGVGLISYSLYLWHQPVFAFVRINSFEEPGPVAMAAAIGLTFVLAYCSWRFVEQPFRDRSRVGPRAAVLTLGGAAVFICAAGLGLTFAKGFPGRFFDPTRENPSGMYISYNARVFDMKTDAFASGPAPDLLVIGDSQARDFVNMATETDRFAGYDIVYRDDLDLCAYPALGAPFAALFDAADFVVLTVHGPTCTEALRVAARARGGRLVVVGPKHFGYNLNKFVQLPTDARPAATARVLDEVVAANATLNGTLSGLRYVDMLAHLSPDGRRIPVFDAQGSLLSADRMHVTRAGARFVGARIFSDPAWRDFPVLAPGRAMQTTTAPPVP